MKRTIAACMIFFLSLCITGCGEESEPPSTEETNQKPFTETVQDSVVLPNQTDTLTATKEKQEQVVTKPEQKEKPKLQEEKLIEVKEKPATPVAADEDVSAGKALLTQSDCLACHKVEEKAIGPSYREVAKKYSPDEASVQSLVHKIINGGSGVWGQIPMSPHPNLKPEDGKKMVTYILSLK